jgi:hypothetical protein
MRLGRQVVVLWQMSRATGRGKVKETAARKSGDAVRVNWNRFAQELLLILADKWIWTYFALQGWIGKFCWQQLGGDKDFSEEFVLLEMQAREYDLERRKTYEYSSMRPYN